MLSAHKEEDDASEIVDDDGGIADLAQETSWKPKQKTALSRREIIGNVRISRIFNFSDCKMD